MHQQFQSSILHSYRDNDPHTVSNRQMDRWINISVYKFDSLISEMIKGGLICFYDNSNELTKIYYV